ncbi:MAG: histidine--tRNA ligase [Clostridia bacterium]|nr:histidine--tRNA ligase [Clostridia bacterium]MBQ6231928.1 histidine--tRNA ligase [Clostridia bacterium]
MLTQAPKGTRDMLPQQAYLWQGLEAKMRALAALWGYREIRTPVFEHTELFLRGVGDTTDIVNKEMYTFNDKGDRSITLKPEGTAGAVRAFIEGRLYAEPLPCKVYYLAAPIFRYENPQAGRLREHHQFGMECFGGKSPAVEAELINLLMTLLGEVGLKNLVVHINSIGCRECRPKYHEALRAYLGGRIDEMCEDCRSRFDRNPLRILDCKKDKCKEIVKGAPSILDCLCDECKEHFAALQELLTAQGIPFAVDPTIVRGLDYYTRTVFEVIMQTGREGLALCGGGRYDNLIEQLGGPDMPAAGFGLGLERILLELKNQGLEPPAPSVTDVYVANIGDERRPDAFTLTQQLRANGVKADNDLCVRSLKAQFKFADKLGARLIVMVGGDEFERGTVRVRNLQTREEQEIPIGEAAEKIREML